MRLFKKIVNYIRRERSSIGPEFIVDLRDKVLRERLKKYPNMIELQEQMFSEDRYVRVLGNVVKADFYVMNHRYEGEHFDYRQSIFSILFNLKWYR